MGCSVCLFVWQFEHVIVKLYLVCLQVHLFIVSGILLALEKCFADAFVLTKVLTSKVRNPNMKS